VPCSSETKIPVGSGVVVDLSNSEGGAQIIWLTMLVVGTSTVQYRAPFPFPAYSSYLHQACFNPIQ
jgi:hypothetical protein